MENQIHISWITGLLNHMSWNIPEQIRALWRIPLREVVEAMGMKWEEVHGCEFIHDNSRRVKILLNEHTNDWQFEKDEDLPYDYFEVKTTIDLVMFLDSSHDLESAVEFLLNKFPSQRIPDATQN